MLPTPRHKGLLYSIPPQCRLPLAGTLGNWVPAASSQTSKTFGGPVYWYITPLVSMSTGPSVTLAAFRKTGSQSQRARQPVPHPSRHTCTALSWFDQAGSLRSGGVTGRFQLSTLFFVHYCSSKWVCDPHHCFGKIWIWNRMTCRRNSST